MECWEKTEKFDKFYKSVQAAHLILLSTKYKHPDARITDENIEVKDEGSEDNQTVDCLALKQLEENDSSPDRDNGK